jgi:hypothetical protein
MPPEVVLCVRLGVQLPEAYIHQADADQQAEPQAALSEGGAQGEEGAGHQRPRLQLVP